MGLWINNFWKTKRW